MTDNTIKFHKNWLVHQIGAALVQITAGAELVDIEPGQDADGTYLESTAWVRGPDGHMEIMPGTAMTAVAGAVASYLFDSRFDRQGGSAPSLARHVLDAATEHKVLAAADATAMAERYSAEDLDAGAAAAAAILWACRELVDRLADAAVAELAAGRPVSLDGAALRRAMAAHGVHVPEAAT